MVRELGLLDEGAAVGGWLALRGGAGWRMSDRGRIAPGLAADVIAFDPAGFGEAGTLRAPNRLAVGMRHVVVNGVLFLAGRGADGGARGRAIRR
jgi:N-acyl-D-amino-acid deacylase